MSEREPVCGFCDGTGLWLDPDTDPTLADPCPLCDGSGRAPSPRDAALDDRDGDRATLQRLVNLLPRLTPTERQRLYEVLHAQYDCRIYRP